MNIVLADRWGIRSAQENNFLVCLEIDLATYVFNFRIAPQSLR